MTQALPNPSPLLFSTFVALPPVVAALVTLGVARTFYVPDQELARLARERPLRKGRRWTEDGKPPR